MKNKILITGGCGFIGTNLIETILGDTDWSVNILDSLKEGHKDDFKKLDVYDEDRVTIIKGDIRDKNDLKKAIINCDYVVNLAAQTGVIPSVENPFEDMSVNVEGLLNVLQVSVQKKIKRFIQASSNGVLGEQDMPLNEQKVANPLSPYGASKCAGEAYCSAFSGSFGLNTVVLRFSNAYGPWSYHKGSVIPLFIKKIVEGEELCIYGDGEQTRDFLYVKDICQAIKLALETELPDKYNLFQVATGTETTVNKVFEMMRKIFEERGFEVNLPKYLPARKGEVLRNYADISKARKIIGFNPETTLSNGIQETVDWFLSR